MEVITERGSAIAHYSNLFVAATTAALEKGNLTATNSTKVNEDICFVIFYINIFHTVDVS